MKGKKEIKKGTAKWNTLSAGQILLLALIFFIPLFVWYFTAELISQSVLTIIYILWFIAAFVLFINILANGKGAVKRTILEMDGLKGRFENVKYWYLYAAFYPLAVSIGALVNGYYLLFAILLISGIIPFFIKKYFSTGFRIDDAGKFYILKADKETHVNFNMVSRVEAHLNNLEFGSSGSPAVKLYFYNTSDAGKPLKIKLGTVRSLESGTFVMPVLILDFIRLKCEQAGFKIDTPYDKGSAGSGSAGSGSAGSGSADWQATRKL